MSRRRSPLADRDQRPATSDQRPATSDQRPATSDQRPALVVGSRDDLAWRRAGALVGLRVAVHRCPEAIGVDTRTPTVAVLDADGADEAVVERWLSTVGHGVPVALVSGSLTTEVCLSAARRGVLALPRPATDEARADLLRYLRDCREERTLYRIAALLAARHGLTRPQQRAVCGALLGLSDKEAAVCYDRSPATHRTHLRRAFDKMGVHGKAELFAHALALFPSWPR